MPQILNQYHTGEYWRGVLYPIGKVGQSPTVIGDDVDLVFSSLLQIFNTQRGERVMYPEFGSDLKSILWEPYDNFLLAEIDDEIRRSVGFWEPRVRVGSITFDPSDNLRNIGILIVSIEVGLINNPRGITVLRVPISSQGGLFRTG